MRTPKWIRKAFLAARVHPFGLGPPAPRRWSIGNAARRLRMVRERRPWERRSRQSFRGGETAARRCPERSPGSLRGEMADFFTWVGRAAHGGHAARTLSREGDAATVTRRRTDRPQWCQVAGMNGSDLEKNRDLAGPRHDGGTDWHAHVPQWWPMVLCTLPPHVGKPLPTYVGPAFPGASSCLKHPTDRQACLCRVADRRLVVTGSALLDAHVSLPRWWRVSSLVRARPPHPPSQDGWSWAATTSLGMPP